MFSKHQDTQSNQSPDSTQERKKPKAISDDQTPANNKNIEGYQNNYLRHYTHLFMKTTDQFSLENYDSPGGSQKPRIHSKNGKYGKTLFLFKQYKESNLHYLHGCVALHEKIAADLYRYLSEGKYFVPKTKLKFLNKWEISITSRYINNYFSFKDKETWKNKEIVIKNGDFYVEHNNVEVLLAGYIRLVTIANFLADWDWEGYNAGYIIDSNGAAKCVKIDPAMVLKPRFEGNAVSDKVIFMHRNLIESEYENMPCQVEFLQAIQSIINLSDDNIRYLIIGNLGERNFNQREIIDDYKNKFGKGELNEHLEKMATLLIARRDDVRESYGRYFYSNRNLYSSTHC